MFCPNSLSFHWRNKTVFSSIIVRLQAQSIATVGMPNIKGYNLYMMKTTYNFLLTLLFSSFLGIAQNNSRTEMEIRKLEQEIVNAILNADTNQLKQLWDEEFLVNNPRNSVTSSLDSVIALQRKNLLNYSKFERNIEAIQFHKTFVITMGNETFVSRNDTPGVKAGQLYKRRFTNIWMKKKENGVRSPDMPPLFVNNNLIAEYPAHSIVQCLLLHKLLCSSTRSYFHKKSLP